MKILHRILWAACTVGGAIAPLWAAGMCRFVSRIAVKDVFPQRPLPAFTQTWVAGAANGSFPILPMALLASVLLAASGLYFLLSGRPSPEARTSGLVVVSSVGLTIAAITLGSTVVGIVLPFLKLATGQ